MIIINTGIFLIAGHMFLRNSNTSISGFKETSLTLTIIDKDNSELSKNLIRYLKTKDNVKVIDNKKNRKFI